MRTKTLVLAAALSVVGLATSLAQSNVYSLNVVGYINATTDSGKLYLVANQLDKDGGNTNNTVESVMGTNGWPNLTRIVAFAGGGFTGTLTFSAGSSSWIGNRAAFANALQVGGGFFLILPAGPAQVTTTWTQVGNVLQGTICAGPLVNGYNLVSSPVPQAGLIKTDLKLAPANLDRVVQWDQTLQTYGAARTWNQAGGSWLGGEPNLAIGESVFLQAHIPGSPADTTWCRTFTVN